MEISKTGLNSRKKRCFFITLFSIKALFSIKVQENSANFWVVEAGFTPPNGEVNSPLQFNLRHHQDFGQLDFFAVLPGMLTAEILWVVNSCCSGGVSPPVFVFDNLSDQRSPLQRENLSYHADYES